MSAEKSLTPYIQLHISVLLYGFTAILGDLISIPTASLVWWRVCIASISLLFFVQFGRAVFKLPLRLILKLLGIGVMVAIHWLCFYGSIKYSHASIALVMMAMTTFFAAFLEPAFLRRKIDFIQVLFGLMVIPGMFLIVQNVESVHMIGIYLGAMAAFMAALFTVANKMLLSEVEPLMMTFLEMVGVWLFLTIIIPLVPKEFFTPFLPVEIDWFYLLVLALLCTTFAYYLSLKALEKLSAFESTLIINLEPVYGVILAIVILQEHKDLSPKFFMGVAIILISIFLYPLTKKLKSRKG